MKHDGAFLAHYASPVNPYFFTLMVQRIGVITVLMVQSFIYFYNARSICCIKPVVPFSLRNTPEFLIAPCKSF